MPTLSNLLPADFWPAPHPVNDSVNKITKRAVLAVEGFRVSDQSVRCRIEVQCLLSYGIRLAERQPIGNSLFHDKKRTRVLWGHIKEPAVSLDDADDVEAVYGKIGARDFRVALYSICVGDNERRRYFEILNA